MIFRAQPHLYQHDADKITFALSHVDQKVLDYFKPYLSNLDDPTAAEPDMLTDYALFKRTIITAFGESNPIYNAENELKRLRQVGSVAEYASNFRRATAILKLERRSEKISLSRWIKVDYSERIV